MSDQQFYCLIRCVLYYRFDGTFDGTFDRQMKRLMTESRQVNRQMMSMTIPLRPMRPRVKIQKVLLKATTRYDLSQDLTHHMTFDSCKITHFHRKIIKYVYKSMGNWCTTKLTMWNTNAQTHNVMLYPQFRTINSLRPRNTCMHQ